MNALSVKPIEIDRWERPVKLRMPFRFGVTTATHGRQAIVRVRIALPDGRSMAGFSAEALGAKWFDKNLALSDEDNHDQLRKSLELASQAYLGSQTATPFHLFADHYERHVSACAALGLNSLIASYGQSLVDRAIVDAICRAFGTSFYRVITENILGLEPHPIIADLGDFDFKRFLRKLSPAPEIDVRHTIGLVDPITASDQIAESKVGDGLPETLEEVIAVYGNSYFKIKISGDEVADLERLKKIAEVLNRSENSYFVTLDGNEQFHDAEEIGQFFSGLIESPHLTKFAQRILYVEQPINRAQALSRSVAALAKVIPVIIDESDGALSAFPEARSLGYTGVSSKACKGIYKSIINLARCQLWNSEESRRFFMSAEDLTCEPGIALQQDLALVNALGLTHVERNAHHFIDGFGGRTEKEARAFLTDHPDLYHDDGGKVRLRISSGKLQLRSLECGGFGTAVTPDLDLLEAMPASRWPSKDGGI